MSFDDTGQKCDEEFDLQPDYKGDLEYHTKYVLLFSVKFLNSLVSQSFYICRIKSSPILKTSMLGSFSELLDFQMLNIYQYTSQRILGMKQAEYIILD